ncbi:MAG: hypothetical protein K1X39_03340 [Thermoflexales bacterium]|nr:hypothetical protein [Thermoflexales bacterium]
MTTTAFTPQQIHDLVARHTPAGTPPGYCAILELIIRRNLRRGRVARVQRKSGTPLREYLPEYVERVVRFRREEYGAWLRAQHPDQHAGLYQTLLALAGKVAPHYAWVPDNGLAAEDIASEAFFALIGQGRLCAYPFDTPLTDWLRQFVWLRARRLSQSGPSRRVVTVRLTDLNEESTLSLPSTCLCGKSGCNCQEQHLDHSTGLLKLRPTNQEVARLWAEGYTVEQTARTLGLTVAAVNNRRARIRQALSQSA